MARDSLELLRKAYSSYTRIVRATSEVRELAPNRGRDGDKLLRFLDCAMIRTLHQLQAEEGQPPFDSVRGLFTEGAELFPGSWFKQRTHVQSPVCNPDCVKGYFRVQRPLS